MVVLELKFEALNGFRMHKLPSKYQQSIRICVPYFIWCNYKKLTILMCSYLLKLVYLLLIIKILKYFYYLLYKYYYFEKYYENFSITPSISK